MNQGYIMPWSLHRACKQIKYGNTTSVLAAAFEENLGQLVPLGSSFTCSGGEPLGISETRFYGQDALHVTQLTVSKH